MFNYCVTDNCANRVDSRKDTEFCDICIENASQAKEIERLKNCRCSGGDSAGFACPDCYEKLEAVNEEAVGLLGWIVEKINIAVMVYYCRYCLSREHGKHKTSCGYKQATDFLSKQEKKVFTKKELDYVKSKLDAMAEQTKKDSRVSQKTMNIRFDSKQEKKHA